MVGRSMRPVLAVAALGVAQASVVALLAFWLHPMEIANAEMDAYVVHVQAVMAGQPSYDGYHPANTSLWGAAIGLVFGLDAFSALRVLGALATGALVAGTWRLTRQFVTGVWPWLAAGAMATNGAVITNGMQAASDMPASAVLVWSAVAAVAACRTPDWRHALLLGLSFGTAVATRFSSAGMGLLLAALLFGTWRWSRLLAAVVGTVVGFLPQAWVAQCVRGNPLATDNWRNLALKQGDFDPQRLFEPGAASIGELLQRYGAELSAMAQRDLLHLLNGGLGKHLLGGGPAPAAAAVVALAGLGCLLWCWRGRAAASLVVVAASGYLLFVCWTFSPLERLLLPLLPVLAAALAIAPGLAPWRAARLLGALPLVAVIATACWRLPDRLRSFVDEHPHAEVEACREQVARPDVVRVASTFGPMSRYVDGQIEYLMPTGLAAWRDPERMLALAIERARAVGADVVVAGRRSHPLWHEVLRRGVLPAGARRERADDDVVVVRLPTRIVDGVGAAAWIATVRADPTPWREGPLAVNLDFAASADRARVVRARIQLQAPVPVGPLPSFALDRRADGSFGCEVDFRPPAGTWLLQGRLTLDDGTHVIGPAASVVVP